MDPRSPAIDRWIFALKPASWAKLLVPACFGQALGVAATHRVDVVAVWTGSVLTMAALVFVVLLNDWGDQEVDSIKRRMFPADCSPKTIPDRILPERALLWAGLGAGGFALALALWGALVIERPALLWFTPAGLAIFVAYSLPPLRLNYRGGGEWLEGLGIGVVLPWAQAYLQSGQIWVAGLVWLPGLFLLAAASAVASGLSDEQSDRMGGKRTMITERGNQGGRALCERLVLMAALAWSVASATHSGIQPGLAAIAVAVVIFNWRQLRQCSHTATTNAFAAQARYKAFVHHAGRRGAWVLLVAILISERLARWGIAC